MKLTKQIIDKIQEAMLHTKMNGDINWQDGDDIDARVEVLDIPKKKPKGF